MKKVIIKKITIIDKDVIPFEKQTQLENLNEINLIFGYNGSGKTVFTEILKKYNDTGKSSQIKIEPSGKKIKFIVFNNFFVKKNFYSNEDNSNDKVEGCKTKFGSEKNIETNQKKNQIKKTIEKIIESIPRENLPKTITNYKNDNFQNLLKILENQNIINKELKTKFKTKITKSLPKNSRELISNIINKKYGSFLDFLVLKKLKSSDFDSNEENLLNLEKQYTSLKSHRENSSNLNENFIYGIGVDFIENKNLLQEINNLNHFCKNSSNYEKYVDNSSGSYEKFAIKLNKKYEFLSWFKGAMEIYRKEQELLKQRKCLLCQKNTFDLSNFKNIFELVNKNFTFKEIEKIIKNKKNILENDESIIDEHCEQMETFEINNYENKKKNIKNDFVKYKNCFENIQISFEKINNFEHIKYENLEIKRLIEKINNEIEKNTIEIENEMQKLDNKMMTLAEKILQKIVTKVTKQELDNYLNVKNMFR